MHSNHLEEGSPSASAVEGDALTAARQLLAEEQQQRMVACSQEISEVLARYGMQLEVTPSQVTLRPVE